MVRGHERTDPKMKAGRRFSFVLLLRLVTETAWQPDDVMERVRILQEAKCHVFLFGSREIAIIPLTEK